MVGSEKRGGRFWIELLVDSGLSSGGNRVTENVALASEKQHSRTEAPYGQGARMPVTFGSVAQFVRGNALSRAFPRMSYMELLLTDQCNLRCSYCWQKDKSPAVMSQSTVESAIDFLFKVSGRTELLRILLFGGEPLLEFDLMKHVVEYSVRKADDCGKKMSFDMTTNGTLLDEERARWCRDNKVKYLLSIDGGKGDHDRFRRFPDGRGSFDTIAQMIPMLKKYQPWQGAKMTVTPQTTASLRGNIESLYGLGINQFIVGHADGLPWSLEDLRRYEESLYEVCELYLEMKYHKRPFRMTLYEQGEPGAAREGESFGCGAGRGRFCVDTRGDLYGCSKLATIANGSVGILPFGNVFQGFTQVSSRRQLLVTDVEPRRRVRQLRAAQRMFRWMSRLQLHL